MVRLLLAHGANVAHKNAFGDTALHLAIDGDNPSVVALLLAHGANADARDLDGKSPLALALDPAHQWPHHAEVLMLLRQHGTRK